jgi:hypothetical protein
MTTLSPSLLHPEQERVSAIDSWRMLASMFGVLDVRGREAALPYARCI